MLTITKNILITLIRKADKLLKNGENEDALLLYGDALKRITEKDEPFLYGHVKNNVGICYYNLAKEMTTSDDQEEPAEGRETGDSVFIETLRLRSIEAFPDSITIDDNSPVNPSVREKRTEYLLRSNEAYNDALIVYDSKENPEEFTRIIFNIGNNYRISADYEHREINLNNALDYYYQALDVYSPVNFTENYLMVQNNCGGLYKALSKIRNSRYNLIRAEMAYEKALEVIRQVNDDIKRDIILSNISDVVKLQEKLDNPGKTSCI